MATPVVEVYTRCDDLTDPWSYAIDCLGTDQLKEVVHFPTEDADTAFCEFTTDEHKVYRFIDWGHWQRVSSPPSVISCVEPEDDIRRRPPKPEPIEPPEIIEPIKPSPCVEKIIQWQRTPHIRYSKAIDEFEALRLSSLENLDAQRLFSSVRKQRAGLRGGVGTRRIGSLRGIDKIQSLIFLSEKRRWKRFVIAQAGNQVAVCIRTRSDKLYFASGTGYTSILRLLGLRDWWRMIT